MLVEFSVSNFRSIREKATLSMVAGSGSELRASNVFSPGAANTPDLLRSAVIYGPNASGKSNLLRAMDELEELVRTSAKDRQRGDPLPHQPFLADKRSSSEPTQLEAIFVEGGVRYQYGVAFNSRAVVGEWLYAFPEGRQQKWFERTATPEGETWTFGPNFKTSGKGQKKLWQEATRPNSLFLSTAVQLNATQLQPVFDWFDLRFRSLKPSSPSATRFTISKCAADETWKAAVIAFMSAADLAVDDVRVEKEKIGTPPSFDAMPEAIRQFIEQEVSEREIERAKLFHRGRESDGMWLDLEEESDGTKRLFTLIGPWIDVLSSNYVLTVDELDSSLHPALLRRLVHLFHNVSNKTNAQLIFSTHDTSILDHEIFRRDQVWFVEKDQTLASHLYPLADFSPRKNENLEKGYLQGRYGAMPVFGGDLII